MIAAKLFRSAASLCAISSARWWGPIEVAAIGPVKGDAVFRLANFLGGIDGQRPIGAGGELSAYCKDSVSWPANLSVAGVAGAAPRRSHHWPVEIDAV